MAVTVSSIALSLRITDSATGPVPEPFDAILEPLLAWARLEVEGPSTYGAGAGQRPGDHRACELRIRPAELVTRGSGSATLT